MPTAQNYTDQIRMQKIEIKQLKADLADKDRQIENIFKSLDAGKPLER